DTSVIVDLVCPFHIENLERDQEAFDHCHAILAHSLTHGDFFLCGNERQRLYWLGMLTSQGRLTVARDHGDRGLRNLIDVVGFGIAEEPPIQRRHYLKGRAHGIESDDIVLGWFGGLWDWLDPLTLIEAVHAAHRVNPRIKLSFPVFRHPGGDPHRKPE